MPENRFEWSTEQVALEETDDLSSSTDEFSEDAQGHEHAKDGKFAPKGGSSDSTDQTHAQQAQSHISKIGRAKLAQHGLDASTSALSDAIDALSSTKSRQEAHNALKAGLKRVRDGKSGVKDKLKKSAKGFLGEAFPDLSKAVVASVSKALAKTSIEALGTGASVEEAFEEALRENKEGTDRSELMDHLVSGIEGVGHSLTHLKDADLHDQSAIEEALEDYPFPVTDPTETDTPQLLHDQYKVQSVDVPEPKEGEDAWGYHERVQDWQAERQQELAAKAVEAWAKHLGKDAG